MTVKYLCGFGGVSTIAQLAGSAANSTTTEYQSNDVPATYFSLTAGKLRVALGTGSRYIGRALIGAPITTTVVVGVKYTPVNLVGSHDVLAIAANIGGSDMQLSTSGSELVLDNSGTGQRGITAGLGLVAGTEYSIEVKATHVSGNNWTVVVRVEGVVVITATNQPFTNSSMSYITFGVASNSHGFATGDLWDDLYQDDTDFIAGGGAWNCRLSTPNGNGAHSVWVNSAGNSTNNYSYVDETNVDDADYVQATNDGDEDTYAHSDISFTSGYAIRAVQINTRGAYLSGAKHIAHISRLGTSEEQGADKTLQSALAHNDTVMTLDPDGNAWTPTNFNNSEFGYKQTA